MDRKKIEIWQIKNSCDYSWMRWSYAKDKFNPYDYKKVYKDIRENVNLESLFVEFNTNHPTDFTGHSMSVSDVIVVKQDNKEKIYYVDSVGFEDITEKWRQKVGDNYEG